jgi:tetratricopeptide (TPR) repeat protein
MQLEIALLLLFDGNWDAITQEGRRLYEAARYTEAAGRFRAAAQSAPGALHSARSFNDLGAAEFAMGRFEEAESTWLTALSYFESNEPTAAELPKLLNNLSVLDRTVGRLKQAAQRAERALTLLNAGCTSLSARHNLVEIWRLQGKPQKAGGLARQAIAESESYDCADKSLLGLLYQSDAMIALERGDPGGAKASQQKAMELFKNALPAGHPVFASAASNYAQILINRGEYAEVQPLLELALEIWEQALGGTHPKVAIALNNLGQWHMRTGNHKIAEAMLRRALHIWRKELGPTHPDVARALNNLAAYFEAYGKMNGAEKLYAESLTIFEHALGAAHAETRRAASTLARVRNQLGRSVEARRIVEKFSLVPAQ